MNFMRKKMFLGLICIISIISIVLLQTDQNNSSYIAEQHLENKYNLDFTHVNIIDQPVNVGNIINGKNYLFISNNGEKVSVVCGKDKNTNANSCVDDYYKYLIYDDMFDKIKSITSKYIPDQKIQIKFSASVFENSWNQNTTLNEALAENSQNLFTNVSIFTYNLNERSINQIEQNMWTELEKQGLTLFVKIFNISLNEYNSLQADSKNELSEDEYNSFMENKGYSFQDTLHKHIKNY